MKFGFVTVRERTVRTARNCADFSMLRDIRDQIETSGMDSQCESEEKNRPPAIQPTTGRHGCVRSLPKMTNKVSDASNW
jgi:hypothetical protein